MPRAINALAATETVIAEIITIACSYRLEKLSMATIANAVRSVRNYPNGFRLSL